MEKSLGIALALNARGNIREIRLLVQRETKLFREGGKKGKLLLLFNCVHAERTGIS